MNRLVPILAILLVALTLTPTAQAAWTTSVSVPASFRPERSVTFAYTAASSSSLDAPLRWTVTLYTCQDLDADGWCETTDANRINHGGRTLNTLGGNTQTATWGVTLASSEGTYHYHFHTACLDNPCTGIPPGGTHNKTGTFELRYTDTWTRTIIATTPVRAGDSQTVQYRLQSSSVDDRDLTGTAHLYSTPEGEAERDHGAQPFSVNAAQQVTLSWPSIDFPNVGTQRLRVEDSTNGETDMEVEVRGVHLHVVQPRAEYTAGNTFGLYATLEGHGATPDPDPIWNQQVTVTISNGTFVVARENLVTDSNGQAYLSFQTAEDHTNLTWEASASITWLGADYDAEANGTILVRGGALAQDVTAIRDSLDDLQLKGVHLDELGSRHLFLTSVRAAGAVSLVIILVLFVIYVAIRV